MQLRFTKMHSHGVDVAITEMVTYFGFVRPHTIARLAQRQTGVGFSYFVVIEHPKRPDVDFDCLLYDAQGQPAPLNYAAARCAARFIQDKYLTGYQQLRLSFADQIATIVYAEDRQIAIELPNAEFEPQHIGFEAERYRSEYDLPVSNVGQMQLGVLQLGELHAVVRVDDIEASELRQHGAQLQQQDYFQRQPNISFIQTVDEHHIRLACYQRLPEAECEHIAAAAVVSAQLRGWLQSGVTVAWAERQFQVNWQPQQSINILGPAHVAFEGRVYI